MTDVKKMLAPGELDKIIKKTIQESLHKDTPGLLDEAYVAEPKQFKQVSEKVSQKVKEAHYELYTDYVDTLNAVSSKLDTVDVDDANPRSSALASLKKDEAYNLNAKWLHELYFANCFDPHSELHMDTVSFMKLQRDFGTFEDWQENFMGCAMAAGEGWAVCAYSLHLRRYVNTVINGHSDSVMLGLYPVIVIDMWSHAYSRDYMNDKKSFLVAQLKEINWTIVEDRFNIAEALGAVLK